MFVFSGRAHLGENRGFRPPPTRLDKHMYVIYWLRPPRAHRDSTPMLQLSMETVPGMAPWPVDDRLGDEPEWRTGKGATGR